MNEYEAAIQKHNEAIHLFQAAQRAYRAQLIDDDGFLQAKAAYDLATDAFDAAYEQEMRPVFQQIAEALNKKAAQ